MDTIELAKSIAAAAGLSVVEDFQGFVVVVEWNQRIPRRCPICATRLKKVESADSNVCFIETYWACRVCGLSWESPYKQPVS